MRTLFLISIAAILLSAGCGGDSDKNVTIAEDIPGFNGRVKSVSSYLYFRNAVGQVREDEIEDVLILSSVVRYDEKSRSAERETYNHDGVLRYTRVNHYDENGNQHRVELIDTTGKLIEKSLYEFDDMGNITKRTNYLEGELNSVREMTYDEEGRPLESKHFDRNGNTTAHIKYDKGQITERINYNNSGDITARQLTTYDENGARVEFVTMDYIINSSRKTKWEHEEGSNSVNIKWYDSEGIHTSTRYETYNDHGDLVETVTRSAQGNFVRKSVSLYDKPGVIKAEYLYSDENSIEYARRSFRKYDEKGNWTVMGRYDRNGFIAFYNLREIVYYD